MRPNLATRLSLFLSDEYRLQRYFKRADAGAWTIDLSGNGIASSQAFGVPSIGATISATGIASAEAFGVPSVSFVPPPTPAELLRRAQRLTIFSGAGITLRM